MFENVGLWKRARYFPRAGEDMHAAVARECLAVRSACGIFDASTLGKIEVVGADAAEFMNRLYVNSWSALGVGRARYGILCRDDGFIYDDGVVARLAQDRFHVTTTTGGAPRVLALMEDYRQTEWPDLKVWLTSTTEQWAVIAVQGPNARRVLEPLVSDIDIERRSIAAHERRARQDLRRADAAVPGELHRRAGLRDQRARRLRRRGVGERLCVAARRTASWSTAPRPCTCCAPRRATSSSARTPTAP